MWRLQRRLSHPTDEVSQVFPELVTGPVQGVGHLTAQLHVNYSNLTFGLSSSQHLLAFVFDRIFFTLFSFDFLKF